MIIIFFIGTAAAVAYFSFKIYRIYDPSQADKYKYTKDFLTFFGKRIENLTFSESGPSGANDIQKGSINICVYNIVLCSKRQPDTTGAHHYKRYHVLDQF